MKVTRRCRVPFKCASFGVFLLLASCANPPMTDDNLIAIFGRNRAVFAELAASASSFVGPNCVDSGPSICVPTGAEAIKDRLKLQLTLPVAGIYVKRSQGGSLWIPVQTYGSLSISSSTRGYVYCECSLEPSTGDTIEALAQGTNGVWYRPIENGWMLFAAR